MVRSHRESVRRSVVAENLRHCVARGGVWSSRGALQDRQKQQGPTTTATCYVVSVSQAREVEAVDCVSLPRVRKHVCSGPQHQKRK